MAARTQLAAELRRLRELAGLSGREMAETVHISQTSLVRTEQAERVPTLPQAKAWARAAGASDERTAMLTQLVEAAYSEVESWREAMSGVTHLGPRAATMDAARAVQQYQPTIVPGLLQTAGYARRALTLSDLPDLDVSAAVAARQDRQSVLFDADRRTEFLITEAALRFPIGPAQMMHAQLDRIRSLCTLDQVTIGIIPQQHKVAAIGWHEFTIYDKVPDGDPFVYTELMHAQLTISDPADIAHYRSSFGKLRQGALFDQKATNILNRLTSDLRR